MKFFKAIPYPVRIWPTANGGFTVTVGCLSLPYTDIHQLIDDLSRYLHYPKKVISEYEEALLLEGKEARPNPPSFPGRNLMSGENIQLTEPDLNQKNIGGGDHHENR